MKKNLGGNKTFKYKHYEFNVFRDYNNVRNIFLMNAENYIGYTTL